MLAADHVIEDTDAVHQAVRNAITFAEQGKLVTLALSCGRKPVRIYPARWGIQRLSGPVFRVQRFAKTGLADRSAISETGEYTGTAVCFCSALTISAEMATYRPDIIDACLKAIETSHLTRSRRYPRG